MAELIDRRDIVFAHKVEGSEEYKEGFLDGAMCVLNAVDEMPTIEAKPVVRCKNCKCYEFMSSENKYFCNKYGGYVTEEDYCSRGEVDK